MSKRLDLGIGPVTLTIQAREGAGASVALLLWSVACATGAFAACVALVGWA